MEVYGYGYDVRGNGKRLASRDCTKQGARHRPRGFCPCSHAARLCRSYHHTQAHEKACRQAHYTQESQCHGLKLKERIARKGGLFRNPRFVRYCEGYLVSDRLCSTIIIPKGIASLLPFPMCSPSPTFKAVPCTCPSISAAVKILSSLPHFMLMVDRQASMISVPSLKAIWRRNRSFMPRVVSVCRWTEMTSLWANLP